MKILYYNHTGQVSGAERVLLTILGRLDRERYEPVVVCPENSRMIELAAQAGARVCGLAQLEARFTWRPDLILKYLKSFADVIRQARAVVIREEPSFIHANSIRAGLVMAVATVGLRVPVIWHSHDILPRHPLSTAVRLVAVATPRNHILAVSNAVARAFRGIVWRLVPRRTPITVIHNAVDPDRFKPALQNRPKIRRALNLSAEQPVVAIVGQLTPRKGQLELIQSFAAVSRDLPEAVLLVVGTAIFNRDEEYARQLAQTADSLGLAHRVQFLGPRDDVPELIQAADVLVVNSHEEPFALTVLEGLASGAAILATAVGGTPEMITHRVNGWLVAPRDREGLKDALLTLLADGNLRTRLGAAARQDAIKHHSIARFMAEVHELYYSESICGPVPRSEPLNTLEVKLSAD